MSAIKSKLLLPTLFLLFISCHNKSISNNSNQAVITANDANDTEIDTTSWLKPSKGIRAIFEDRKGNLWFGSTDYVCMFDGENFQYFDEIDDRCGKGTNRIQEDHNDIIWIQSGPTICSYDPSTKSSDGSPFTTHPIDLAQSGDEWANSANDLWFKTESSHFSEAGAPPGVFRYHDGQFSFLAFPVPPSKNANQLYNWMTKVVKGQDGTIWFGTMEAAIGFREGDFTIIGRKEMRRQDDSRHVGIRGIFEDSKGNIWMADNGAGAFVYNGDTTINFTKMHQLDKGDTDGNSLHRTFSVAEDNDGNMWFGTVYSGIWKYDPASEKLTNFTEKDGVKSDVIWTIYKTRQGDLLFAGEDPGAVYQFNGVSFDRFF